MGGRIKTVSDYVHAAERAEKQLQGYLGPEFGGMYYRGVEDKSFGLLPSLLRKRDGSRADDEKDTLVRHEGEILNVATTEFHNQLGGLSYVEKLVWMQHHGLPTRLLDVSSNMLVALYFAVADADENSCPDGCIYVLGVSKEHVRQSYVCEGDTFSKLTLSDFRGSKRKTIRGHDRGMSFPMLLRAPKQTERQVRQSGEFLLMDNQMSPWKREMRTKTGRADVVSESGVFMESIYIPAGSKVELKKELADCFGITRHFLFPEDPDCFRDEMLGMAVL